MMNNTNKDGWEDIPEYEEQIEKKFKQSDEEDAAIEKRIKNSEQQP